MSSDSPIFITGATGFVGSAVRAALAGRALRLLVRRPEASRELESERVELVGGDVTEPGTLAGAIDGCETVVHLVAVIEESGRQTFDQVIRLGTEHVVEEARRAGAKRFVQMSALGAADRPGFPYFQAKWAAEETVRRSGLQWTILRPSTIFGPGDGFFRTLAGVVGSAPVIPVIGDGKTRFQPVAVGDVATAVRAVIDDDSTIGGTYDLTGPETVTFEEILDLIARETDGPKRKIHIPVGLMKGVVALTRPLPQALRPPVTNDQLKMLAIDSVTDEPALERLIGRPPLPPTGNLGYLKKK